MSSNSTVNDNDRRWPLLGIHYLSEKKEKD